MNLHFSRDEEEPDVVITSGKYFRRLMRLPLSELKEHQTAREALLNATQYPINQVEERFKALTLSNRPVLVREWPTDKMKQELEDALLELDPSYKSSLRSMKDLKKMPILFEIMSDTDHVVISDYCVQIRICGKKGCKICKIFGRELRTPETDDGALRDAVCSFVPLPIPDPTDADHYLGPKETLAHIIRNELSFEDQKKHLPPLVKEKDSELARDKQIDKELPGRELFKRNKARATIRCVNCPMIRVVYSMYEVGSKEGGPKKKHAKELQQYIEENIYICGAEIPVKRFEARRAIRCNDPIESQYYNAKTTPICCICGTDSNIASREKTLERQKYAVKNPLPVCSDCLELNIKIPGGGTNYVKKNQIKQSNRTRLVAKAVQSGRKKAKNIV